VHKSTSQREPRNGPTETIGLGVTYYVISGDIVPFVGRVWYLNVAVAPPALMIHGMDFDDQLLPLPRAIAHMRRIVGCTRMLIVSAVANPCHCSSPKLPESYIRMYINIDYL